VRDLLGLTLIGQGFEERFLITDIRMQAAFPSERWFWFEPPFHNGQSALLHKQPDDIWRIDLQLGPDADPDFERRPENVAPRIRAMIGDRPFEIDWISVYTFQCRRLARFVHGRVVFAGDSAHVVSPFGARGGNGGIQDVDNLCWKLAAVIGGAASPNLLATYDEERAHAADENLLNSSRATSFMTPKSDIERTFRDQVLALAAEHPFARRLVNSGRLSVPCSLAGLSLQSGDDPHLPGGLAPGSPAADAPVLLADGHPSWLLSHLGGRFVVLAGTPVDVPDGVDLVVVGGPIGAGSTCLGDPEGLVRQRYDLESGTAYLIRPEQHVAARFRPATRAAIADALARARGGAARP
jgi:3-(3-hydroxy-phenyl)propionate hydroxylase